jgi:hypothetical protein
LRSHDFDAGRQPESVEEKDISAEAGNAWGRLCFERYRPPKDRFLSANASSFGGFTSDGIDGEQLPPDLPSV